MKLSLLFGLSLFGCSVLSHPHAFDQPFSFNNDELDTLERRQSGRINTVGAPGNVEPRLEIRQMESQQPNQFTLTVLAFQKFMAMSENQMNSYFGISSVHGVPRTDFNGVPECSTCAQGGKTDGYCTHDSVLFPAWHRAYLALFEQEFVQIAKSIANSYPSSSRAAMVAAANTLRLPYWDWAAKAPGGGPNIPAAITTPQIKLNTPNGQQTIANPLYQYKFTNPSGLLYTPFNVWKTTIRWPTSQTAQGKTQEAKLIAAFNRIQGSLKSQVYKLMTACDQYLYFSNDRMQGQGGPCGNSLEQIHNTVHTTAGGVPGNAGHMLYLSLASFDPVFWLHHSNVDRLFALWQTLHPSSYGASQQAQNPTWTIPKGSMQGPNSPLTPFYRSGNTFWTTTAVKDWHVFKYTYPEFQSGGSQAQIAQAVNTLYGPGGRGSAAGKRDLQKRGVFDFGREALAEDGSAYEYVANVVAPRYALNGSYVIYLFLGAPTSEDATTWMTDDNLVGPLGVLSMDGMTDSHVAISGQIPLTESLADKLGSEELADLSPSQVGPLLKNLLDWRIVGPAGDTLDPDSVPNFKVTVYAATATNPDSADSVPVYSEFVPMTIATDGKKGGELDPSNPLVGLA